MRARGDASLHLKKKHLAAILEYDNCRGDERPLALVFVEKDAVLVSSPGMMTVYVFFCAFKVPWALPWG